MPGIVAKGVPTPKTLEDSENDLIEKMLGTESYGGLATSDLNRGGVKKKLIFSGPKNFDF